MRAHTCVSTYLYKHPFQNGCTAIGSEYTGVHGCAAHTKGELGVSRRVSTVSGGQPPAAPSPSLSSLSSGGSVAPPVGHSRARVNSG